MIQWNDYIQWQIPNTDICVLKIAQKQTRYFKVLLVLTLDCGGINSMIAVTIYVLLFC